MRLLYPGSFNPFHEGHFDIYKKASALGEVVVAPHQTFKKIEMPEDGPMTTNQMNEYLNEVQRESNLAQVCDFLSNKNINAKIVPFWGLLKDFVILEGVDAIVRGLRNGDDLQYEMNMQYWNEDLGISIPTIYFISDRTLSHISSSKIRELKCYTEKKYLQ